MLGRQSNTITPDDANDVSETSATMPEDGGRIMDDTDSQLNDTATTRNDVSVQLDEIDAVPETAEPTGDGEQVDDTSSLHTLSCIS